MLFIRQICLFSTVETIIPVVLLKQVLKSKFSERSPTVCVSSLFVIIVVQVLEHYPVPIRPANVSSGCSSHEITS
jgi:hypothetical protein